MIEVCAIKYSVKEIEQQRAEVAKRLMAVSPNIKSQTIETLANSDLRRLFELYDELFLQHYFANSFKGKIKFSLSPRLTKCAGKTICPKNINRLKPEAITIEIRIGPNFFFEYDAVSSIKMVGGLPTQGALEALQMVFEHELCHVLEFINFYSSKCGQKRFKTIAYNIFGHLNSYHKLPTYKQIVQEKFGLVIGADVSFTHENQMLRGLLYRINKRAVVMVKAKDGIFSDHQGNRYHKYFVPVEQLKKEN